MKKWTVSNIDNAKYIGILEFEDSKEEGEYHDFEVLLTEDGKRIVFGGATNTGFLETGYMIVDEYFSLDENLQELLEELETLYRDGKEYTNRIVINERY